MWAVQQGYLVFVNVNEAASPRHMIHGIGCRQYADEAVSDTDWISRCNLALVKSEADEAEVQYTTIYPTILPNLRSLLGLHPLTIYLSTFQSAVAQQSKLTHRTPKQAMPAYDKFSRTDTSSTSTSENVGFTTKPAVKTKPVDIHVPTYALWE